MLKIGFKTDRGKLRDNNEDYLYVNEKAGLFVVADGMGGHSAGKVASRLAVERIKEYLTSSPLPSEEKRVREAIIDAIQFANKDILKKASWYKELQGMGATVVLAMVKEGKLYVSHVGDSRAYLLRGEDFRRLTKDNSLVTRMVTRGHLTEEQARHHYLRGIITQALGKEEALSVRVDTLPYEEEDVLLLCTDGLTNLLKDEEIKEILLSLSFPQEACNQLVERANQEGGIDNITVVVVKQV